MFRTKRDRLQGVANYTGLYSVSGNLWYVNGKLHTCCCVCGYTYIIFTIFVFICFKCFLVILMLFLSVDRGYLTIEYKCSNGHDVNCEINFTWDVQLCQLYEEIKPDQSKRIFFFGKKFLCLNERHVSTSNKSFSGSWAIRHSDVTPPFGMFYFILYYSHFTLFCSIHLKQL